MENVTLILGGSGGLGQAVARHFPTASNWSLDTGVDVASNEAVDMAVRGVKKSGCMVIGVVNCVGINNGETFDAFDFDAADRMFRVNALALPNVVQSLRCYDVLARGAAICNVISNAAHMPMTHSLAYNATKAAQEMITRQMARELKEYCIFGVNPNKLSGTRMSLQIEAQVLTLRGWTAEQASQYQLAALPAGMETPPEACAAFIAELMNPRHHPFITGCIFPYGGPQ